MRRVKVERELVQLFLCFSTHRFLVEIGLSRMATSSRFLGPFESSYQVAIQQHFLGFPAGHVACAGGRTRSSVSVRFLSVHRTSIPPKF